MYSIFNIAPNHETGINHPARWNFISNRLRYDLNRVNTYYRQSPYAVNSSHFLVKLLTAINVPLSLELDRYYDNIDAKALNISMALDMTSSIYKGNVFDGIFYGDGNSELLLAHSESFDIEWANKNWETLSPVVVLRHPRSDLGLNIADGKNTGVEDGIVVIAINIPLLAIQYRAFRLKEASIHIEDGESERSIMQFVHMYPIANMLSSQLDIAIFNRLDNLEKGAPLGESTLKHPFGLVNVETELNVYQNQLITILKNTRMNFYSTLKNVQMLSVDSLFELTAVPEIAPTRQAVWVLIISRLPIIEFLFRTAEFSAIKRNGSEVNAILRKIKAVRYSNLMKEMLPISLYMEVESSFDRIINRIKGI